MKTLLDLYNKYKVGDWPDKNSVHSYIEVYQKIFEPYRHTAKNILEIGLMSGESLRMWSEYFDGNVWGMDCSVTPINGLANLTQVIDEGYNVVIGDATNESDIDNYFRDIKFDIVIDDASHSVISQLKTYDIFKKRMFDNSMFVIEDIQDIDYTKELFYDMDSEKNIQIIDRRNVKGRYDDVLVIITDKK